MEVHDLLTSHARNQLKLFEQTTTDDKIFYRFRNAAVKKSYEAVKYVFAFYCVGIYDRA